jgi:hypothetical protein
MREDMFKVIVERPRKAAVVAKGDESARVMKHSDPYVRLRLHASTPVDGHCCCPQLTTAYLAHVLTENPIHCSGCRGMVAPERIGFDAATAEVIARWNTLYGAVYELWLDSGKYEAWAESELLLPDSPVNESGLRARERLSSYIPCRYLWFWQERRPVQCPVCGLSLRKTEGTHLVCTACAVYV